MNLNFSAPFNSLSFGFCGFNILNEMFTRPNLDIRLFPHAGQADLSSYKVSEAFKSAFQQSYEKAMTSFSRKDAGFKLWHIEGSQESVSNDTSLFTFFETDAPTASEINILNNQKCVLVSSQETKETLVTYGVKVPVVYAPLGFDKTHFFKTDKKYYAPEVSVFGIFGKFERRKHHAKAIKAWLKKYANRRDVVLHTHISNPHLSPENHNMIYNDLFGGNSKPYNVNIIPYVRTLGELNDAFNAVNIVIDMSGAEGFSVPSFSCLALGKHAVIHHCSAMKDWANTSNACLVKPKRKIEAHDGVFFHKGRQFSQGNIYDFDEADFIDACELAISRRMANPINTEGLKLQDEFTWSKTTDTIISTL